MKIVFLEKTNHIIYNILKSNKKIFENIIFITYSELFKNNTSKQLKNNTLKQLKVQKIYVINIDEFKKINFLIKLIETKNNKELIWKYFEIISNSYNKLRYFDINILENINNNKNIDQGLLELENLSVSYNINFEILKILNNYYIKEYS